MYSKFLRAISMIRNWSPEGKNVQLVNAEGPSAADIEGAEGKITSVLKRQEDESEQIHIYLDKPIKIDQVLLKSFLVVPRHRGYDSNVLVSTRILVYVFAAPENSALGWPHAEEMLAMAELKTTKKK